MDAATRYTPLPSFITMSVLTMISGTSVSHTVEEMQKFARIHTPIPPSAHVVRVSVPLSSCAEAARLLIDVFGGEVEAKRVLGGVRWWQVRANDKGCVFVLDCCLVRFRWVNRGHSIDAEWIMEKKDWRQSIRQERDTGATPAGSSKYDKRREPC